MKLAEARLPALLCGIVLAARSMLRASRPHRRAGCLTGYCIKQRHDTFYKFSEYVGWFWQALLCGDVLATGWFCAERGRISELAAAQGAVTVAVLGLGPVGLMAVVAARQLDAQQVLLFLHVAGSNFVPWGLMVMMLRASWA